jgi:hypothetical protein
MFGGIVSGGVYCRKSFFPLSVIVVIYVLLLLFFNLLFNLFLFCFLQVL